MAGAVPGIIIHDDEMICEVVGPRESAPPQVSSRFPTGEGAADVRSRAEKRRESN